MLLVARRIYRPGNVLQRGEPMRRQRWNPPEYNGTRTGISALRVGGRLIATPERVLPPRLHQTSYRVVTSIKEHSNMHIKIKQKQDKKGHNNGKSTLTRYRRKYPLLRAIKIKSNHKTRINRTRNIKNVYRTPPLRKGQKRQRVPCA